MTDVKRLLAEATPLPWGDPADIHYGDYGWYIPDCPLGETEDTDRGRADIALAVHAVNSLPDYEAAVDALAALADAATALENRAIRSGGEFHVWAEERMLTDARDVARAALARLRGAA